MISAIVLHFAVGHLYGTCMEIISLKAPGNYSASFWSYHFSICLWENLKLLISMISALWDVSRAPKTNYFSLWRHHDTETKSRKIPVTFYKQILLRISTCWTFKSLTMFEKAGTGKSRRSISYNLESLGNEINLFCRKYEMEICFFLKPRNQKTRNQ